MARVRLIEKRAEASELQLETFDHIAASRGKMLRPFAAMLHRPEIARAAADLGAVIRYQGTLSDADRELVICVVATERACGFEWENHSPLALAAGVDEDTLQAVEAQTEVANSNDAELVDFARELCRSGAVTAPTFEAVQGRLGEAGTVELAAIVGYYSMIALVLGACDAC